MVVLRGRVLLMSEIPLFPEKALLNLELSRPGSNSRPPARGGSPLLGLPRGGEMARAGRHVLNLVRTVSLIHVPCRWQPPALFYSFRAHRFCEPELFSTPKLTDVYRRILPSEYRGTSLIRKHRPLNPYSRTMPRALWGS